MSRPVECIVGGSEQQLGDLLADGRITDDDAEKVRRFREFLENTGPPSIPGQPLRKLTPEQRAWKLNSFRDPEWREFLGITEAEARAAVEHAGEPWEVTS